MKTKIGFLRGTFKLLHPGHIKLIQDCSSIVDELYILIDSDSRLEELKKPIIMSQLDRRYMLQNIKGVCDVYIFSSEENFLQIIRTVSINRNREIYYFKGGDYSPSQLPEKSAVEKLGATICCVGYSEGYSSTNLTDKIEKIAEDRKKLQQEWLIKRRNDGALND
jgi:cytidyltransferase-like protein